MFFFAPPLFFFFFLPSLLLGISAIDYGVATHSIKLLCRSLYTVGLDQQRLSQHLQSTKFTFSVHVPFIQYTSKKNLHRIIAFGAVGIIEEWKIPI